MKIAVYGKIGSGKSTVARLLSETIKFPLLSADEIAKDVYPSLSEKLIKAFGTDKRKDLAKIVFNDKQALETLNHIFKKPLTDAVDGVLSKHTTWIVETPLLVEYKMEDRFDFLVYVDTDVEIRTKRLMETRQLTLEEARSRISAQGPRIFVPGRITIVISNDGDLSSLEKQVKQLTCLILGYM